MMEVRHMDQRRLDPFAFDGGERLLEVPRLLRKLFAVFPPYLRQHSKNT